MKGSMIQNWMYSMFCSSKLLVCSERMIPPQRDSGARKAPSWSMPAE